MGVSPVGSAGPMGVSPVGGCLRATEDSGQPTAAATFDFWTLAATHDLSTVESRPLPQSAVLCRPSAQFDEYYTV